MSYNQEMADQNKIVESKIAQLVGENIELIQNDPIGIPKEFGVGLTLTSTALDLRDSLLKQILEHVNGNDWSKQRKIGVRAKIMRAIWNAKRKQNNE